MTQKSVHTFIVDGKKVALHRGHTMFEINCQNGAVKKADMTYDNFVKIREQCVYVPALNVNYPLTKDEWASKERKCKH